MKEKSYLPGFITSERGAAAVEFCLVAPLLMLLAVGLVDMGTYIKSRMKLEQMSRAAVDYVMQGGLEENITTDIIAHYDSQNASSYAVTLERICTCQDGAAQSCTGISCEQGDHSRQYIQVSLDRTYSPLFFYPGIPAELSLKGHTRLRLD